MDETVEIESEMEVTGEVEIAISEDVEMSNGETEEEEAEYSSSDGSSESSESGESLSSTRSRKRPAEESPEREPPETIRKEFPGTVTRSEGGCRIHLPVSVATGVHDEEIPFATPTTVTADTPATPTTVTSDTAVTTTTVTIVTAPTSDATIPKEVLGKGEATETPGVDNTAAVPNLVPEMSAGPEDIPEVLCRGSTVCEPMPRHPPVTTVRGVTSTECLVASGRVDVGPSVSVGGLPTMTGTGAADGWMRGARMVETIFQIIEGMEPPWVTIDVLEVAVGRFPNVDREFLRHTIMTVMMTQRRCVVRLTRAGLRLGPRTDRDGNAFVELDLDFADRYSTSH